MTTIKRIQDKLITEAKEKGLTENFGQKEIRKLLDSKQCNPYGTDKERAFHSSVMQLDNWAMNYCG